MFLPRFYISFIYIWCPCIVIRHDVVAILVGISLIYSVQSCVPRYLFHSVASSKYEIFHQCFFNWKPIFGKAGNSLSRLDVNFMIYTAYGNFKLLLEAVLCVGVCECVCACLFHSFSSFFWLKRGSLYFMYNK